MLTFKKIEDFIKLKIQKSTLFSLNAKFNDVDIICIFIIKTITRTYFANYDKIFNFNNNIKITYKNMSELAYIMLLNETVYDLIHNEYLLMSKKTVNKSIYAQFVINKSNISFFYIKYTSMLKKSTMTFFNVAELNSMSCRLKNKFKNFINDNFCLNKTLNLINFSVVNENSVIKKSKKSESLINEKCKIVFFVINKNLMLKKLKRLKFFQCLDKSKEIVTANSNNIKTENE